MNTKALTLTAALALVTATGTANAGTLDLDAVSADAIWLVHVDVERLTDSNVGRFLREHGDELDIDMGDLEEMQEHLGLDVWRDVMSVTVYGTEDDDDDGVMVLVTNDRIHRALGNLAKLDGVEHDEIVIDDYDVATFRSDDGEHYVHVRSSRRDDRNVVVLAEDPDLLVDACRVLSGDARSLSRASSPLTDAKPRRGSIVFIAASDVEMFDELEEASEIVRLTDAVVIDVGEREGDMYARATVSADDKEDARDIVQVLRGMLALGRLAAGEDEELAPLRDFIRGIEIDTDGRRIMLGVQLPTRELIEALEALEDEGWDDDDDDDDDDDWDDDDWDDDEDEDDDDRHDRRRHRDRRHR